MNIDNTLYAGRPTERRSEVEIAIYDKLDALGMDYKRADHDHADTMEDCLALYQRWSLYLIQTTTFSL